MVISTTMTPPSQSHLIPIPTHIHRFFCVKFGYVMFEALHIQVAEAAPESWEEHAMQEAPSGERVIEEGGTGMEVEGEGMSSAAAGVERVEGMGSAMEVEGGGMERTGVEVPPEDGVVGSVVGLVRLSFTVGLGGLVSVGLRAVASIAAVAGRSQGEAPGGQSRTGMGGETVAARYFTRASRRAATASGW